MGDVISLFAFRRRTRSIDELNPDDGTDPPTPGELNRAIALEFDAMDLIEKFGSSAAAEAMIRRNRAWRDRDHREAYRWRAVIDFIERVEQLERASAE